DRAAAQRAVEFFLGWFADPIYFGDYPESMRQRLKERLPQFTPQERDQIKGSNDFFGLNHYTTMYASDAGEEKVQGEVFGNGGLAEDQDVQLSLDPKWKKTMMGWPIVPWGIGKLLHWIDERYSRPQIVITENGCALNDQVVNGAVTDPKRIAFLKDYIGECHRTIQNGVNLKGYFVWSLMDNFEWAFGYTKRFGIYYIDYDSGKRIPKSSAQWYQQVIKNNGF
ncbi:MAG TPA: family 1 glycosylhydrolase, partial [bacterium]